MLKTFSASSQKFNLVLHQCQQYAVLGSLGSEIRSHGQHYHWSTCQQRTLGRVMLGRQHSSGVDSGAGSAEDLLNVTEKDGVKKIMLNDAKRRNCLSLQMLRQLQEEFNIPRSHTSDTRAIVIAGNGPVFSSGHNLKELTSAEGRDYHYTVFKECSALNLCIQNLHVPVIAQVTGLAAAAGCQLVASCDIVVASKNASFSTPGINFGLFCSTPGVSVARALPRKISMYMLLTGLPITAQEAYDHGMVSVLVDTDSDVEERVGEICAVICSHSKPVISMGKSCFYRQTSADSLRDAYTHAEETMITNLSLRDGQEGIRSFIEKRKPQWAHTDDTVH